MTQRKIYKQNDIFDGREISGDDQEAIVGWTDHKARARNPFAPLSVFLIWLKSTGWLSPTQFRETCERCTLRRMKRRPTRRTAAEKDIDACGGCS